MISSPGFFINEKMGCPLAHGGTRHLILLVLFQGRLFRKSVLEFLLYPMRYSGNYRHPQLPRLPQTNDLLLDLAKIQMRYSLKLLRDSYGFDIGLPSLGDVGFKISANRENKSGTKAIGGTLGFFTIELPEPVDYETTKFSLDTSLTQKLECGSCLRIFFISQ